MIFSTFKLPNWGHIIVESEVENFDFVRKLSFSFSIIVFYKNKKKISLYTLETLNVLGEEKCGRFIFGWWGFRFTLLSAVELFVKQFL